MPNLRMQILQHEPFEGAGLIEDWARERGHAIAITLVYNNEPLPRPNDFDWLVIMGGGMSVNDEDKYDWLKPEKELIRQTIAAGKIVTGICLGSQMIASALGKKVYKNAAKEIGWYPIQLTHDAKRGNILNSNWHNQFFFHWHGETFDLPDGAVHLASSECCTNQAFCLGTRVYGFQFHPETNTQTLLQMVQSGAQELVKDQFVMEPQETLRRKDLINKTKLLVFNWLDDMAKAAS
jgi:GMP synthase-like glutamine amidotransferase